MSAKTATGSAAPLTAPDEPANPGAPTATTTATGAPATGAGVETATAPVPASAAATPAPQETREAFRAGTPRTGGSSNVRGMAGHMARCLETLGLKPGASLDEINTTYFTIIKRFPADPTEDDEAHMQELKRAYDTLRRGYVPPQKKKFEVVLDRRVAIPAICVATVVLAGALLWFNWGNIQLKMTHYEPGDVLRLKSASVPFGTIVGYETAHQYPLGQPGAAYEVRLEGKTDTVWVSERLIVNGMVPVGK